MGDRADIKGWQFILDEMGTYGLTAEDGMRQAWYIDTDGRVTGGAEAINDALKEVWWARPFAMLYRVPGLRQIEDRVYRWVADNRHRMPGSTDACAVELPPDQSDY